jgi:hypothetical protein
MNKAPSVGTGQKKLGGNPMPSIPEFHSVNATKDIGDHVYHNNSTCIAGRQIPRDERRPGTGGYRLCEECERKNKQHR